ncbi:MAG: hypothetical protein R2746_05920 [Acidimicrobiales bacterium]
MKALWPELLARPHIAAVLGPDAEPEGRHQAWPIPARVDEIPLTAGRVLWVGDAAAATDPMTGEGIGQALATGVSPPRRDRGRRPVSPSEAVRSAYEQAVRRSWWPTTRCRCCSSALRHRKGARGHPGGRPHGVDAAQLRSGLALRGRALRHRGDPAVGTAVSSGGDGAYVGLPDRPTDDRPTA